MKVSHANDVVEVMTLADFPHKPDHLPGSFLRLDQVWQYLKDYTDHYQLETNIKLNTTVETVSRVVWGQHSKWKVGTLCAEKREDALFDVLVVCSGKETAPFISNIPGLDNFQGPVQHSHDFRTPGRYKDQNVLVIGSGPSSIDIGRIVASEAKVVYHSFRIGLLTMDSKFSDNILPIGEVKQLQAHSVVFETGESFGIDAVILCTGYKYSFPFLPETCQPMTIEDEKIQRLSRLYKMTVHVDEPDLFFVGMPKYGTLFHLTNFQSQLISAIIAKKCSLPNREGMLEDIEEDFEHKLQLGVPITHIPWFYPSLYFIKQFQESVLGMVQPGCIQPIPEELLKFWDNYVLAETARPKDFRQRCYPPDTDWNDIPQQKPIEFK